jgi:hypothetical protein
MLLGTNFREKKKRTSYHVLLAAFGVEADDVEIRINGGEE